MANLLNGPTPEQLKTIASKFYDCSNQINEASLYAMQYAENLHQAFPTQETQRILELLDNLKTYCNEILELYMTYSSIFKVLQPEISPGHDAFR